MGSKLVSSNKAGAEAIDPDANPELTSALTCNGGPNRSQGRSVSARASGLLGLHELNRQVEPITANNITFVIFASNLRA